MTLNQNDALNAINAATGSTTDSAVVTDVNGSLSGKLRGLVKIFADVWDSVNHRIIVDGSEVTQPVSGSITANAGTNLNTSLIALESGGNLAAIATDVNSLDTKLTTILNNLKVITIGNFNAAVASGTSADTVIKASAGVLFRVLVTSTDTHSMEIYDNASTGSGIIIGIIPGSPTVGSKYEFVMPASNGITVKGDAANPGITVNYD